MGASPSAIFTRGGSVGLRFVPVHDLMEQVHACLTISERDFLHACLSEMHRRFDSLIGGERQAAAFHEEGAVDALIQILSLFRLDEVLLRQAVQTLIPMCEQDDTILEHFLGLGGRDALADTLEMHKEDPFITKDGAKLMSVIRRYAKGLARLEAEHVANACRYCLSCRPLVHRPYHLGPARNMSPSCHKSIESEKTCLGKQSSCASENGVVENPEGESADPKAAEFQRIERLLDNMERYSDILDVVEPCVDALIAVGKSGITQAVVDSKCAFKLVKAMKVFPKARSLQWKGLLAITHLAKKDPVCADLGKAGVVPLLSALWTRWEDDEIRQLVLWAMGEVARLETNQLRMSAERMGALMREEMEPVPARLASTGSLVTAEQAGHYCIPVKLKKLYRQKKLGSPFAPEEEPAKRKIKLDLGLPHQKPKYGKVGDDWSIGQSGLV